MCVNIWPPKSLSRFVSRCQETAIAAKRLELAKLRGGAVVELAEDAVEVGVAIEAYEVSHFRHAEISIEQITLGLGNPATVEIVDEAHVREILEEATEVELAEARPICQLIQGKVLSTMLFDVFTGFEDDVEVGRHVVIEFFDMLGLNGLNASFLDEFIAQHSRETNKLGIDLGVFEVGAIDFEGENLY